VRVIHAGGADSLQDPSSRRSLDALQGDMARGGIQSCCASGTDQTPSSCSMIADPWPAGAACSDSRPRNVTV
jgi:hypothetical protein